jgi:subtilisin family serine protease
MSNWFNKILNNTGITKKIDEPVVEPSAEDVRRAALEAEKVAATKAGQPWVAVLDTQVNKDNIRNGFFELDWNNEFIEELLDAGYQGESNEQIVDQWFRTIVSQMLQEEGQDPKTEAGYINVVPIDKGKSEVS